MEGGTFSISNLGMFGINDFDAIINPPQGAILAVGAVNRALAEGSDGEVRFESRLALTLSCDHRAVDGAEGARFMATLKGLIEAPEGFAPVSVKSGSPVRVKFSIVSGIHPVFVKNPSDESAEEQIESVSNLNDAGSKRRIPDPSSPNPSKNIPMVFASPCCVA